MTTLHFTPFGQEDTTVSRVVPMYSTDTDSTQPNQLQPSHLQEASNDQIGEESTAAPSEPRPEPIPKPDNQAKPEEELTPAEELLEYRAKLLWTGQLFSSRGHTAIADAIGELANRFWGKENNRKLTVLVWNAMMDAEMRADMKWEMEKDVPWL